jgi:hypothetical protein
MQLSKEQCVLRDLGLITEPMPHRAALKRLTEKIRQRTSPSQQREAINVFKDLEAIHLLTDLLATSNLGDAREEVVKQVQTLCDTLPEDDECQLPLLTVIDKQNAFLSSD